MFLGFKIPLFDYYLRSQQFYNTPNFRFFNDKNEAETIIVLLGVCWSACYALTPIL